MAAMAAVFYDASLFKPRETAVSYCGLINATILDSSQPCRIQPM